MSAAEFRIIRERLGLSQEWLARYLNVSRQTIAQWEKGKYQVPDGVANEMTKLESEFNALVFNMASKLLKSSDREIRVYRFDEESHDNFPAMWHRMVAARAAEQVPGTRIEYAAS